jgi:hypothetical protein
MRLLFIPCPVRADGSICLRDKEHLFTMDSPRIASFFAGPTYGSLALDSDAVYDPAAKLR